MRWLIAIIACTHACTDSQATTPAPAAAASGARASSGGGSDTLTDRLADLEVRPFYAIRWIWLGGVGGPILYILYVCTHTPLLPPPRTNERTNDPIYPTKQDRVEELRKARDGQVAALRCLRER